VSGKLQILLFKLTSLTQSPSLTYCLYMDNTGQITEEVKNEIYKKIVDIMLVALENGAMTAEDSESASIFILDRLDKAPDQFYLDALLEEFANRWPVFSPLLAPKHAEEAKIIDEQNIATITNEIKNISQ